MLNIVLNPDDLFKAANDEQWPSFWAEYFSLGAWPQFGLAQDVLTTPEFVEGNMP